MVWLLVRFPDCIALEFITAEHQGSDCTAGFRKENWTAKLGLRQPMTSKIERFFPKWE
jgi:hypothetical protein